MGGRSEVINTKMSELLQYMIISLEEEEREMEEKRYEILMNYYSYVFAQPVDGKENPKFKRQKQEFLDALHGKDKPKEIAPSHDNVWDFELMKKLKQQQQKGG